MQITLNPNSIDDYKTFLKIKRLPIYDVTGRSVWFPDEYSSVVGLPPSSAISDIPIVMPDHNFDYQRDGSILAIRKRKFAAFWRPGLGKTNLMFNFVRHARKVMPEQKRALIISPLMVIDQTLEECERFYPGMKIEQVKAKDLAAWTRGEGGIGITNYEALTPDVTRGNLGLLALDESSLLKSHYGKWGQIILQLGRGLDWKLCLTGTPAPNDRIEYANHAVFLDHHPNVNSFLAKYFVNRGQTNERWEIKPHALEPFYRGMSHWAFFLNNPATYGWKDNCDTIPPIRVHIDHIETTPEQDAYYQNMSGNLLVTQAGGIGSRSKMSQLAKGHVNGEDIPTNKFDAVKTLIRSWPGESTIIWCKFNPEQDAMAKEFPDAANIDGKTPHDERAKLLREFKAGRIKVLISKPKILQFGLNLQVVTRHVWSTLQDSYEEFFQGCCRSNRVGSTKPLDVHIPVSDLERPMIETVLTKAKRVQQDMDEQEIFFKKCSLVDLENGVQ